MSTWYQTPPDVLCYGLRLAPLQLGHLFLLAELGSPLVVPSPSPSPSPPLLEHLWDILLAVLVCSTPHDQSRKVLKSRLLPFFFSLWARRVRKMNAFAEMKTFDEYFLSQRQVPEYNIPQADTRELTSPGHFRLLYFLCHEMHLGLGEAMSTTVLLANHLWATHVDFSGKATFWTERHEALWEFAAREDHVKAAAAHVADARKGKGNGNGS